MFNEEFWKQMLGSWVRHIVMLAGAFLVTKGWLTEEQAGGLFNESLIVPIVGTMMVAGGFLWAYLKVKFNISFIKAARQASPMTSLADIKMSALQKDPPQASV